MIQPIISFFKNDQKESALAVPSIDADTSTVPTFKDLSFYSKPDDHTARYASLINCFKSKFNAEPEFLSRSPGRVNLLGEHIDYSYFSTLPMAIEYDMVAAVRSTDKKEIIISNTDSSFPTEAINIPDNDELVSIDKLKFSWGSYFKCGLIVAQKYLIEKQEYGVKLRGLEIMFNGTVPTGGGLSSSAAFCVASTMAVLRANGVLEISKEDLTRITVVSEHYVGVNTGGMDQCASVYGENGKALLVQFKPKLEGRAFAFPETVANDMSFLITNCLVQANKKETAPTNYNLRAVEVAIAAEYLARAHNLELMQDSNLGTGTLRGFMDSYFYSTWDNDIDIGISRLTKMCEIVEVVFNTAKLREGLSLEEISGYFGISQAEFSNRFLSKFPVKFDLLRLYQRSKHVYAESLRVLQTLKLMREGEESFLTKFGELMDSSQESLTKLFGTSTDELNKICKIARLNGSFGSRITGAGWGGCVVHLTKTENLTKLKEALRKEYYQVRFPQLDRSSIDDAMTVSLPAMGTCVIELKG